MRNLSVAAILAVVTFLPPSAASALEFSQAWKACYDTTTNFGDYEIGACTQIITSGRLNSVNLSAAFGNRALGYANKKEYDKALPDYARAISLNGKNFKNFSNRAYTYRMLKRYDESLADFNRSIKINPKYAYAHNTLGDLYVELQKYPEAVASYDRAIELEPGRSYYWADRGWVYLRQWGDTFRTTEARIEAVAKGGPIKADTDQAFSDFAEALKLKPDHIGALNGTCFANILRKLYVPAVEACGKSIAVNRNNSYPWQWRAYAYHRQGNFTQAISDTDEALKLSPASDAIWNMRGNAYKARGQAGDSAKAIEDYTQSLKLDPKSAVVYRNRANTYLQMKNYPAAIGDFTRALEQSPDYLEALADRARTYSLMGDTEKAEADAIAAAKLREKPTP